MSEAGLRQARDKMVSAGVPAEAIEVFSNYYRQLESGATGLISEDSIDPLTTVDQLADMQIPAGQQQTALGQTVVIKLNGGLGTSMGMERAKSLLPIRGEASFLDLIADQVMAARHTYQVALPLLFMDSFRTRDDTLAALDRNPELPVPGLPQDFLQNREPKLRADDLTPISWPADESLEWCPPGHGDLYTALVASGVLDKLLAAGYRYASVSNSDNLGATPNPVLAGWFAASGAPYAAEICKRTPADRKGGHLAVRKSDGRLILRDTAQTPPDDMDYFTDEHRHPYFHTNNLWFDLKALQQVLTSRNGVIGLPLIKNIKNVDPSDPNSPEVIQIESAMGAAIEIFQGATAIVVGRDRFLPVKTTNDLALLRSDCYRLDDNAGVIADVDPIPAIDLDLTYYKQIDDFDRRFPHGVPSLANAQSLTVTGDWTFGADVTVTGEAVLDGDSTPRTVADHVTVGERK
jgi:UTP--glucose-1-phosphate uridylyltransferase